MPEPSRIYLYVANRGTGWVHGVALAQDGTVLAIETSTSERYLRGDLEKVRHFAAYASHYPAGYELQWVQHPESHEGVQAALKFQPVALTVKAQLREISKRAGRRRREAGL